MNLRILLRWVMLFILLAAAGAAWVQRGEGQAPSLTPPPLLPEKFPLGKGVAELPIEAADLESGLRTLSVVIEQHGRVIPILDKTLPGDIYLGGLLGSERFRFTLELNAEELGLEEGRATLLIATRDWSWAEMFQGNEATLSIPLLIDLTPPRVSIESGLTYVRQGGAAAVVYTLSEKSGRDGVQVGDTFFRGFTLINPAARNKPSKRNRRRRVAIFAVPVDSPEDPPISVVVKDLAGNKTTRSWETRVLPMERNDDKISLPEKFLKQTVPDLAQSNDIDASDPIAAFQKINTELRAANEAQILKTIGSSFESKHWAGAFRQLPGSKVTSRFAERRSYFVGEEQVSSATHYGFDLASTAGANITASNAGVVIFADTLGIYGECIIIDHGLGISSLYGHLSQIDVKVGDKVAGGVAIGRSGATGLAGGDHLHFAILVGKTYVDPTEWWDPKWVNEHIVIRLKAPDPGVQP